MVYDDETELSQCSFALSRTEIKNLKDGDMEDVEEVRDQLPERVQRFIYDVAIFSQVGLLDDLEWKEGWEEVLQRCSEDEIEAPPIEEIDTEIYRFNYLIGKSMKRLQYETDFTDRISMIVGMLDGLIEGSYISPEDQRELRDIRSSIDTLIESYEVDIGAIKEATIEAKQSSNLAWGEVRKRGIEPTTGVQLLVLTKKDQSPEYSASDAIEEVLDETKLSEFDRLADCLNGDLRKFDQIYSGSYTLSDVISGLMSLEDSSNLRRTDRYPAKDIAAEVHDPSIKSQIGNVLGKVSDTSDRTPWADRPLIYKYKSRPSAQYQITPYGRLAFEFYDNKSTRPRVRLHKLAWYEYWKTAETVSDIHPDNLLGGNYEQELNLAIEASEQILS